MDLSFRRLRQFLLLIFTDEGDPLALGIVSALNQVLRIFEQPKLGQFEFEQHALFGAAKTFKASVLQYVLDFNRFFAQCPADQDHPVAADGSFSAHIMAIRYFFIPVFSLLEASPEIFRRGKPRVLHFPVDIAGRIITARPNSVPQKDIRDIFPLERSLQEFPVKLGVVPAVGA